MGLKSTRENSAAIREYHRALMQAWGPQDWWPGYTRFEVIVGAFLTQNTAWSNVERALRQLRRARVLNLAGIRRAPLRELEQMVRSAGHFRQKARRLKNFVDYLDARYGGSLLRMFARPTKELRQELLALEGVGPETADSILLYAGGHPVFVVDAYTRRILERHRILPPKARYEDIRQLVERAFNHASPTMATGKGTSEPVLNEGEGAAPQQAPGRIGALAPEGRRRHKYVVKTVSPAAQAYDEYHALLVRAAKLHCLKGEARCEGCPLHPFLPKGWLPPARKHKK